MYAIRSYYAYGVLGGIGVGIIYGVPLAVAAKWYPEKKGLAVGVITSYSIHYTKLYEQAPPFGIERTFV